MPVTALEQDTDEEAALRLAADADLRWVIIPEGDEFRLLAASGESDILSLEALMTKLAC